MPEESVGKDRKDTFRRVHNHPRHSRARRAYEHFQHVNAPSVPNVQKLQEQQAEEATNLYLESGKLVLPSDLPTLLKHVKILESKYDPLSPQYETIGRLKYDLVATILRVLPNNVQPTHNQKQWQQERENARKEAMGKVNPEFNTARGVYLILLDHFAEHPGEIPFSSLKLLSRGIEGLDFTNAERAIDMPNSDLEIKVNASKRLLPFYTEVYENKRSELLGNNLPDLPKTTSPGIKI